MRSYAIALAAGAMFGLGLTVAGMGQPTTIMNAFRGSPHWDAHLYLLFLGAACVNAPVSAWLRRRGKTLRGAPLTFTRRRIDWPLVLGSILFGVGWGLGGICPGPGITSAFTFSPHALAFLATLAMGIYTHALVHTRRAPR